MKFKSVFVSALLLAFSFSQVMNAQAQKKGEPWIIPAEYKTMKNPVVSDATTLAAGKTAYDKNCASCHGKLGKGDGPKGRMCKVFPGDFSGADFQAYSEGTMFYQTKAGRGEMPAYDKKIPDNDIWKMVIYMKSLKQ